MKYLLLIALLITMITTTQTVKADTEYSSLGGVDAKNLEIFGGVNLYGVQNLTGIRQYIYSFGIEGANYVGRRLNDSTQISSNTDAGASLNTLIAALAAGDSIHVLPGNYSCNAEIILNEAYTGIYGSGEDTTRLRVKTSTLTHELLTVTPDNCTLAGITLSGLGYDDNRDGFGSPGAPNWCYDLVSVDTADNFFMINCIVEHWHQYLLEFDACENYVIRSSEFRYGQNGIATWSATHTSYGLIENNYIHDCSQGSIKLRYDNGTIIRNNVVNLEYTYWRAFDHYGTPGLDGRGVVGNTEGANGIYFGTTDPLPSWNVNIYSNTFTDASVHGTVLVQDVVDGTWRTGPENSYGVKFPNDSGGGTSDDNLFTNNTVTGCHWSIWVQDYTTRGQPPTPITASGNTLTNNAHIACNLS
jgi:hypothetical protein